MSAVKQTGFYLYDTTGNWFLLNEPENTIGNEINCSVFVRDIKIPFGALQIKINKKKN